MKRKCLVFIIAIVIRLATFGQNLDWGISGGVTVGYIQTNAFILSTTNSMTGIKTGFTLGAFAGLPIKKHFIFQPGFQFVQKGGRPFDSYSDNQRGTIVLNYIEIPLNLVYKSAGRRGHFIAGGGPSLAFGISGTVKLNQQQTAIHFGGKAEYDLKVFDLGANMLTGYELNNGFSILLDINAGLINVAVLQSQWLNNYASLRFGYFFNHKKNKE